jgi:hypothetical protein
VWEFLQKPAAQLIISVAILAMISVLAVYIVRNWRDRTTDDRLSANDLLSNYREMHSRGEITEAEFRTIKRTLKGRLEQELDQRESADSGNNDAASSGQ